MAKLRKKHNKSLVILIPVLILVVFAMFLTYSFANFRIVKIFDIVAANFNMNSYTLSYDVQGCTSKTITNNQPFGELCNPTVPSGYTFSGWYLDDELIISTTKVRVSSDITLSARFIAAGTGPTFTAKNVQSDYVYLMFDVNSSNVQGAQCYYGTTSSDVSTLADISETVCRVPVNAAYAKICITSGGNQLCSNNKKLADYIIVNGQTTYSVAASNAAVTINQAADYLNFTIAPGGGGRMGMRISGIDVTLYNSVFIDMSYNVTQSSTLEYYGLVAQSYFDGTLNNNDNVIFSARPHASTDENYNASRGIFPAPFRFDTSNTSTYSNTTFEIGRNSSTSTTDSVNIYNMWFQLRD